MPNNGPSGSLIYRMAELEKAVGHLDATVADQRQSLTRLEALPDRVAGLTKAAYWVAGIIVASSIGFAFSVLTLFQ